MAADAAPVAYAPGYTDVFELVLAFRVRASAPGERLDALARLSTYAELAAIVASDTAKARGRTAHLLLAETARALYALLTEGAEPGASRGRAPRPEPDAAARVGLAARVARMAGWLGARLPAEAHVGPAHALCVELHASLL